MDWLWMLLVAIRGVSPSPNDQWATRLAELDIARAQAFATADPRRLADVYAGDSSALKVDAASIEAYAGRDGRVVDAELKILSCRVLRASTTRVRLEVVDQLGPARVAWGDGTTRDLPRDLPSHREVVVVLTADGWRIAESRLR